MGSRWSEWPTDTADGGLPRRVRAYDVAVTTRRRLLLGLTSPLVLIAAAVVLYALPWPRPCRSIDCGPHFNSGAIDVFGAEALTLPQTLVMAAGIWATAWLLARVVLPTKVLTSAGVATVVLAFAIAWLLPERVVGPEPSVPCSTPDVSGQPVAGRCATGPPPVDNRVGLRVLVLAAGLTVVGLAAIGDVGRRHGLKSAIH
jgi:hypothetical protein